jgi:hypothetical protein
MPGGTLARISWKTDVPGDSRVDYGETVDYEGGTVTEDLLVTDHEVVLTGLTPETDYHFHIISKDQHGNEANSGDQVFSTSASSGVVSDDYSTCEINDRWTFIDPLDDGSFVTSGQQVEISVPADSIHNVWTTGIDAPRLMQPANDTDLAIEVKFDSALEAGGAMQGLVIEQDEQTFIRYNFYRRTEPNEIVIHAYSYKASTGNQPKPEGGEFDRLPNAPGPMYMRIVRQGNTWELFYSFDGENWTRTAQFDFEMAPNMVGVFAGNTKFKGITPAHTAVVDYFFNSASPIEPEDSAYQLTFQYEGSGTVETDPEQPGFYCGQEVTLTAVGSPGWGFVGWGGDLSGGNPTRTITVLGDMNIVARFEQGAAGFTWFLPVAVHRP